ncbi:hypothetical protein [Acinetobacter sp. Marseille-Q1623]|uniref:hypothetical protein n=1 Tax=Acinetobacter sp. Marseille-Q1623 TaxID=2697501 RepID=UPI00157B6C20|nr:hypothetical protein [Acinetobacter sp. Marseille-Q1623]
MDEIFMPLPDKSALIGANVTEQGFKTALGDFIDNASSKEDVSTAKQEAVQEAATEADVIASEKLEQAKEFALEKNNENKKLIESIVQEVLSILFKSQNKDTLFDFADKFGSIVMQLTLNGGLKLVGLDKDLVSHLNSTFENFNNKHLFLLLDANKNIIAYIDKDSKLFIVGLDTDVAAAINSKANAGLEQIDTSNLSNYSYRDTFISKAERLLNFFRNTQNVGLLAPVPLHSFEQNFSISDTWLDQAKIESWGNYHPVKTPYGSDRGVVHPQILEFPNKFMGYRYILAITGYTNGVTAEENPFLLGSNDLSNFELLTPLLDEPDSYTWEKGIVYNSDPFMFYDVKTSELVLIFRTYWADTDGIAPNDTHEILYTRRTKDGKAWSDREILNDKFALVAPAVIFDAKTETYHLYGVGGGIQHYTSKTGKNDWVFVNSITTPAQYTPWHLDIKQVGDKQIVVVHDRIWTPTSKNRGFFLGISSDFQNFKWASDFWNTDERGIYKATFLPQFNDQNQMRLMCLWTSDSSNTDVNLRYKLFVQPTPFLDVNFTEK